VWPGATTEVLRAQIDGNYTGPGLGGSPCTSARSTAARVMRMTAAGEQSNSEGAPTREQERAALEVQRGRVPPPARSLLSSGTESLLRPTREPHFEIAVAGDRSGSCARHAGGRGRAPCQGPRREPALAATTRSGGAAGRAIGTDRNQLVQGRPQPTWWRPEGRVANPATTHMTVQPMEGLGRSAGTGASSGCRGWMVSPFGAIRAGSALETLSSNAAYAATDAASLRRSRRASRSRGRPG